MAKAKKKRSARAKKRSKKKSASASKSGRVLPGQDDKSQESVLLEKQKAAANFAIPNRHRKPMERAFKTNFSDVRIHKNSDQALQAGAQAFTQGKDIHFAPGQYRPETSQGKELLKHELTHVVQQEQGRVNTAGGKAENRDRGLEREAEAAGKEQKTPESSNLKGTGGEAKQYRIPNPEEVEKLLSKLDPENPKDVASRTELIIGLKTAIRQELDYCEPAEKEKVEKQLTLSKSISEALASTEFPVIKELAGAVISVKPKSEFKDPALMDAPIESEEDIKKVVALGQATLEKLKETISGAYDKDLVEVFGEEKAGEARRNYQTAIAMLQHLGKAGGITVDRSGHYITIGMAGEAEANKITLLPHILDNPTAPFSITHMIHEIMHVSGPASIVDLGYHGSPGFSQLSEEKKIKSAAHYEEVPRRIMGHKAIGGPFVPIATGSLPSTYIWGARKASEHFRISWSKNESFFRTLIAVYMDPAQYNAHQDLLKKLSEAQKLTLHKRLDPKGLPSPYPVTQIDLALAEDVTKRLYLAGQKLREIAPAGPEDIPESRKELRDWENRTALRDYILEETIKLVGPLANGNSVQQDLALLKTLMAIP